MQFIYAPRAGNPIFAQCHNPQIAVLIHGNCSRTVVGGCHLTYFAAAPREGYWRRQAVVTAKAIVQACGGIAWDKQGQVSLIVPQQSALAADALMRAARGAAGGGTSPNLENLASLVRVGHVLSPDLRGLASQQPWIPPEGDIVGWKRTGEWEVTLYAGPLDSSVSFARVTDTKHGVSAPQGFPEILDQAATA